MRAWFNLRAGCRKCHHQVGTGGDSDIGGGVLTTMPITVMTARLALATTVTLIAGNHRAPCSITKHPAPPIAPDIGTITLCGTASNVVIALYKTGTFVLTISCPYPLLPKDRVSLHLCCGRAQRF